MVCRFGRRSFFARRAKVIFGSVFIVSIIHWLSIDEPIKNQPIRNNPKFMGRHNDVEPTLIRVRRNHTSRTTSKLGISEPVYKTFIVAFKFRLGPLIPGPSPLQQLLRLLPVLLPVNWLPFPLLISQKHLLLHQPTQNRLPSQNHL